MAKFIKIFKLLIILAYPFLIFYAHKKWGDPRYLSIILILAVLFQLKSNKTVLVRNIGIIILITIVALLWIFKDVFFLQLYPVLINLSLLGVFGLSLKFTPTMAERFARLKTKILPPYAIVYCRKVTIVWCAFFIANASVSFYTSFMSMDVWVLYNGLISYLLIGTLMVSEFCFRIYYMKKMDKGAL